MAGARPSSSGTGSSGISPTRSGHQPPAPAVTDLLFIFTTTVGASRGKVTWRAQPARWARAHPWRSHRFGSFLVVSSPSVNQAPDNVGLGPGGDPAGGPFSSPLPMLSVARTHSRASTISLRSLASPCLASPPLCILLVAELIGNGPSLPCPPLCGPCFFQVRSTVKHSVHLGPRHVPWPV